MENASKALIIAGSILLSILIIALGMYIFSSSSGVTDDTTLSQMETSTFNGKFNKYTGRQNGTNVSALLDVLISNINGKTQTSEIPQVDFYENGAATATYSVEESAGKSANASKNAFKEMKNALESSHVYFVYMATNNDTDLIHGIIISYSSLSGGQTKAETLAGNETTTTSTNTANKSKS